MFLYLPSCKNIGVDIFCAEDNVLYAVDFCQSFYLFKTQTLEIVFLYLFVEKGLSRKV